MYIPKTIKKIGERAFEGCTQLESVQLYNVTEVNDTTILKQN